MNDHDALLRDIELERADAGTIADRASLADQLRREHYEGMAADRLDRERREFRWDIEGRTADGELMFYIAGSGLHKIPYDELPRLANALLAEHQLRAEEE